MSRVVPLAIAAVLIAWTAHAQGLLPDRTNGNFYRNDYDFTTQCLIKEKCPEPPKGWDMPPVQWKSNPLWLKRPHETWRDGR